MTPTPQPPVTQPLENVAQFVNAAKMEVYNRYMVAGEYEKAYHYAYENHMAEQAKTALRKWGDQYLKEYNR